MLMRTDSFRDFDQLAQRLLGTSRSGTWSRSATMALDAYRDGAEFVVAFDLPGAGQLGNLTPVVGTLTTVALLGDRPSWPQLVGGGAILAGYDPPAALRAQRSGAARRVRIEGLTTRRCIQFGDGRGDSRRPQMGVRST
jgi:hypothetical protein